MAAVNSGRIAPGGGYVAALCPPATVSIEQVKIPVGCGGVYTQREVPESDGDGVHRAAAAAAIWKERQRVQERKPRGNVGRAAALITPMQAYDAHMQGSDELPQLDCCRLLSCITLQ